MSMLQRVKAAWQAFRAYEAAISTPQRRHVVNGAMSADAATEHAYPRLREWGRYLDENHDLAVGILDELVKSVCGSGIVTIPKPMRSDGAIDEVFGAALIERWKRWIRACDVTGELHWHEAQRVVCRSWMRDGEEFVHHVTGRNNYPFTGDQTPYRIELLESDLIPHDLHDRDNGWRQGIRLDAWRRPLAYAVYLEHPGEFMRGFGAQGVGFPSFDNVKIVPAEGITHLKCVKRWPQTRGVSVLHPVIARLYDIKDLEESERIKNRILASWTAAIKRAPDTPGFEPSDADGTRYLEMAGGTIIDTLAPGEEITGIGPEYPNPELIEHVTDQIRRVAAGAGVRYSSISKRYDGTYSAQRQELVESEGHYQMRMDTFVQRVCRSVYERWLLAELMSGRTALPPGMDFSMAANAEFRGPVTPWIDPLKEVQADALAVSEQFVTREQVQIKRGASPEIIGREPARREPASLSVIGGGDEENEDEDDAA